MICKYFLPFCRLPFYSVDSVFYFNVQNLLIFMNSNLCIFFFCYLCLWWLIQEVTVKSSAMKILSYVVFKEFSCFRPYI